MYARTARHMGDITPRLVPQRVLARMAHPFYHSLARGGEGHLEVAKNVYYTTHGLCHMVLALKPFGCMPSSQSDGVQSAVVNRFREMIFLPIETSGEGEINAHSRVQMALGEAKNQGQGGIRTGIGFDGQRVLTRSRLMSLDIGNCGVRFIRFHAAVESLGLPQILFCTLAV